MRYVHSLYFWIFGEFVMINNFLSMKIHELTIRHLSFQCQSVLDFTHDQVPLVLNQVLRHLIIRLVLFFHQSNFVLAETERQRVEQLFHLTYKLNIENKTKLENEHTVPPGRVKVCVSLLSS